MGTVTNPLSGLIDGMLQGHNLALQLQRAADEHQAMLTNEALHNQQMSVQDIQNKLLMQQNGRPVVNGTVQDQMNMPDTMAPTAQPSSISSSLDAAAAPTAPPSGNDTGAAGAVPGRQVPYLRKPDASRTVTYKDAQKNTQQYELYTPQEQAQRQLALKSQGIIQDELAQGQGKQMFLNAQRKAYGVPVPADVADSFPAGTPKVLMSEVIDARENKAKAEAANQTTLSPGQQLINRSTGKSVATGGPELPSPDFGVMLRAKAKGLGKSVEDLSPAELGEARSEFTGEARNPTEASLAWKSVHGTPDERADATAALERLDKSKLASRPVTNNNFLQPGVDSKPSDLHGQDYLNTLPPAFAARVKNVAAGGEAMPSGQAANRGVGAQLANAVYQYDPDFSTLLAQKRSGVLKEFTNSSVSKAGGQVLALNTLIHHADLYMQAADALKNGSFRPGNAAYNAVSTAFGSAAPTNANLVARFFAGETGKVATGGVPAEGEIKGILSNLGTSSSPDQMKDAGRMLMQVVAGKLAPLKEKADDAKLQNFVQVLGPDAKGILQRRGFDPETMKPIGGGEVPHVTTKAQFDALPKGTTYTEPDGKQYTKP